MARYSFRCPECRLSFEISRPMSEASQAATCPADGATATRVFVAPDMVLKRSTGPVAPAAPRSSGFSHHGHSHGPGSRHHSHGSP
ncbi:MAG TPA: FmdB family zinc ribbon protein [Candidatus Methylomirabilis sp.]|nr:FmdB family zinc ribbon protein [Candidatus Methylomirabilis sp.]